MSRNPQTRIFSPSISVPLSLYLSLSLSQGLQSEFPTGPRHGIYRKNTDRFQTSKDCCVKLFGAMDSTWKNCINGLLTDNRTSLNGFKRNGTRLSVYFPMHLWTGLLSCLRGAPQRSEPGVGGGEAGPCSPLACCSLSLLQSSCCAYLGT